MNQASSVCACALLFGSMLMGCADARSDADDTGVVELSLAEPPDDARCLHISVNGLATVEHRFPLTPGRAERFALERLPVGVSTVDARAFSRGCDSVSSETVAQYVLESPATLRVKPELTRIVLRLIRNGRLGVEVEFPDDGVADNEVIELALIGDTPYGAAHVQAFPSLVEHINAARVDAVVHLGDIKNGSSPCDTSYFERIFAYFDNFEVPLIFTPGDNEWTDCHRANNGAYDPLERLAVLRRTFYPTPGLTLAEPKTVLSQAVVPAHAEFVENQLWYESGVAFSAVHVVGSSNGYAEWFGTDTTGTLHDDPDRRIAEVERRIAASLDWIDRTFDLAETEQAKGVVVFMQADTFQGSTGGFLEIVQRLAERAHAFSKPVLLVQGDSHRYLVDLPMAAGNAEYDIDLSVPNLTRIVVEGETIGQWLKVRIDPTQRMPFAWEPMVAPG